MTRLREAWPQVRITVRGDSGFCNDELMTWCEKQGVDYVLGLAKNERLKKRITTEMEMVRQVQKALGRPRGSSRNSATDPRELDLRAAVVAKVEYLPRGENPRFIVTSVPTEACDGRRLYEDVYCARVIGESHQGAAVGSVCGPDLVGTDPGQSAAFVFFGVCVPDGADVATGGAGRDQAGAGAELDPATETAEDRSPGRVTTRKVWLSFPRATRMPALLMTVLAQVQAHPLRC